MEEKQIVPGSFILPAEQEMYSTVRGYIITAQRQVYAAVNAAMVTAYWNIGRKKRGRSHSFTNRILCMESFEIYKSIHKSIT